MSTKKKASKATQAKATPPKRGRPPKPVSILAVGMRSAPLLWPTAFREELARRIADGATMRHMALEMGITPQILHYFVERPGYQLRMDTLERMANYFGWRLTPQ